MNEFTGNNQNENENGNTNSYNYMNQNPGGTDNTQNVQNIQNAQPNQSTQPNTTSADPKFNTQNTYAPYNGYNYYEQYQPLNNPENTYMEENAHYSPTYTPVEASFKEVTPQYPPNTSYGSGGSVPPKEKKTKKRQGGKGSMVATVALIAVLAGGLGGAGTYAAVASRSATTTTSVSTNSTTALQTGTTTSTATGTVADVAASVASSVVEITTTTTSTGKGVFGQAVEDTSEGAGSGVIVTADGYIVTNNHVVDGASVIKVRLTDGSEYDAELIGVDSQTDLAVLKIEATNLNAATFGDSDSLVVGEEVVAIGNPLGTLGGTVTNGIVSATNREITIENETMELIQTTAAINPGNSGGGLFNTSGQLVGIVNAKSSGTGIEGLGFAIPSNSAKDVVEQIISNGYVSGRVKMGLSLVEVSDSQTAMMYRLDTLGVYIAETSGEAQSGDLIEKVDGQEVSTIAEIKAILETKSVGDKITLTILRDSKEQTITITLQEQTPTSSTT